MRKRLVLTLLAAAAAASTFAQPAPAPAPEVAVRDAWVRATVPGQRGTGAFMTLTAPAGSTLLRASTPVAGVTEIHEMKLDGGVMRMRAIPQLALPAGQPVELKPGGYHLMLMDLKTTLPRDTQVPITLVLRNAQGAEQSIEVKLPVGTAAPRP